MDTLESTILNEGFRPKGAYTVSLFGPIFSFCRIKPIFGRLTCFDMNNVPQLFPLICALFSRNNVMQKTQFSKGIFWRLLNEKQKKPFVSLNDEVTEVWHFF